MELSYPLAPIRYSLMFWDLLLTDMVIFWRLVLAHLLSDFTFQTDFINRWKRRSVWGMLVHCLIHLLVAFALTHRYINLVWVRAGGMELKGWMCVLILGIVHFIEDEVRVLMMRRLRTSDGTWSFLFDQLVHIVVIFTLSPMYAVTMAGTLFPEKWVVLLCLCVGVTHALTVFVYFLEKDLYGAQFPEFDEKYLVMAERLVLWGFFLLPGYWWVPFLALWVAHIFYLRKKRVVDFSKAGLYVGVFMTFLLGTAARWVY